MKLEDELVQIKPFESDKVKFLTNVVYTGLWLTNNLLAILKPYKLNDQHFNILTILNQRFPETTSAGDIKNVLVDKRGDLTRQLDKLTNLGLIERRQNPFKMTQVLSLITKEGQALLNEIESQLDYEKIFSRITV